MLNPAAALKWMQNNVPLNYAKLFIQNPAHDAHDNPNNWTPKPPCAPLWFQFERLLPLITAINDPDYKERATST